MNQAHSYLHCTDRVTVIVGAKEDDKVLDGAHYAGARVNQAARHDFTDSKSLRRSEGRFVGLEENWTECEANECCGNLQVPRLEEVRQIKRQEGNQGEYSDPFQQSVPFPATIRSQLQRANTSNDTRRCEH